MNIASWFQKAVDERKLSENPFHFEGLKKTIHTPGMYIVLFPGYGLYIGSTGHLYRRRIKHIADLKNGVHENKKLQDAYNKSEEKRFLFLFVEAVDRLKAVELEQLALDHFQDDALLCNFGRNARSPNKGMQKSAELLKRMSADGKARYANNPELRKRLADASRNNWQVNRSTMIEKAKPCLAMGVLATSQSVSGDGIVYPSISAAARAVGKDPFAIQYRIKSKNFPTWFKMTKENTLKVDGIVLWTDGSCIPNPGFGGWGFHAFGYSDEVSKRGAGMTEHYVTNMGYVFKEILDYPLQGKDPFAEVAKLHPDNFRADVLEILRGQMKAKQVSPLFYLDHFGATVSSDSGLLATNNTGEVRALVEALEYSKKLGIRRIQIYADSEYALAGFNNAINIWARNQWRRRDGMEIKNKELWQRAWDLKQSMQDFDIKADWLKGHDVFYGNHIADTNANLGRCMSVAGIDEIAEHRSEAQGYWKPADVDKHPLVCHQKLFFNGDYENHVPGTYYMGAIDKDLGLFGKRLSDTSYSVVKLKTPIESLEKLVDHHCSNGENRNEAVIAHLSNFFKADTYRQFMEFGDFSITKANSYSNDMVAVGKLPVTEVVDPPKRAMDAMLAVNNIQDWVETWKEKKPGHERFVETDLTAHLYESSTVTKKKIEVKETKLLASIKPGSASVDVEANYRTIAGEELQLQTTLSFGIDMPDRLGLKRIEELDPTVTLLSWEETPGVFRYLTVVEAEEDIGAYCGYYSNVRLNKAKKKKAK